MPEVSLRKCCVKGWLPVIVWAALIFLFSSDLFSGANTAGVIAPWLRRTFPAWSADQIDGVHLLIRKLGHVSEYFIFALLLMRALRLQAAKALDAKQFFLGIAVTALYAISDELHQIFVPSRSASDIDVLIDVCGGLAGSLCFYFWSWRKQLESAADSNVPRAEKNLDNPRVNREDNINRL